jgi:SAM-dependent methyltransferase
VERNYGAWNEYSWPEDGDEWSIDWGSRVAQWYGCLHPRIADWLPAGSVLEIAPGHGRWSEFLIQASGRYRGVDLAPNCVEFCRKRFAAAKNAEFFIGDGMSLPMIESGSCDFVFSFDSLVHVGLDILKSYLSEVLRVLKDGGVAFIHHSNAGEHFAGAGNVPGWRGRDVTAELAAECIEQCGGFVWVQEKVNWENSDALDCFTTFGKRKCGNPARFDNELFMLEAMLIRTRINRYHTLEM